MVAYRFNLYELDFRTYTQIDIAPKLVSINDDDPVIDDEETGYGSTSDNSFQNLAASFSGRSAGNAVESVAKWSVRNVSTGRSGYAYLVRMYNAPHTPGIPSASLPWSYPYYQAFDFSFSPGDQLVYSREFDPVGQIAYSALKGYNIAGVSRFGTADADTLVGTADNDVLNGWLGADKMSGLGGDDVYYVDSAGDEVIEDPGDGYDTVRSGISYTLGEFVEELQLIYNSKAWGTGNDLANTIGGNGNDNVLRGLGGDDTLFGGAGNDTLDGGAGGDFMYGGVGDDTYVVDSSLDQVNEAIGEGTDTITTGYSHVLGLNVENLTLLYNGNAWGTGNELSNVITGNIGNNVLAGKFGNDTLTGGAGADRFVFDTTLNAALNVDTITDFSLAQGDRMQLENAIFSALAPGGLNAADFVSGTAATNAAQNIIFDGATGKLYYDADGNGAAAQVQFAKLDAGLALTAGSFTIV